MRFVNKLKDQTIKHLFFDFDGLLVNSEKLYFETWSKVLNEEGKITCKNCHEGKVEADVYRIVKPYLTKNLPLEVISRYRRLLFDNILKNNGLEIMEGIEKTVNLLAKQATLYIISNSSKCVVERGLIKSSISTLFAKLYCWKDGIKQKPEPDLYLIALKELKLNNNEVLAFEDSISGLEAALSASIPVICINNSEIVKLFCTENNIEYFSSSNELYNYLIGNAAI